jgi:hypothetical protein
LEADSEGPAFISRAACLTISQFIMNLLLVRDCGALSTLQRHRTVSVNNRGDRRFDKATS